MREWGDCLPNLDIETQFWNIFLKRTPLSEQYPRLPAYMLVSIQDTLHRD